MARGRVRAWLLGGWRLLKSHPALWLIAVAWVATLALGAAPPRGLYLPLSFLLGAILDCGAFLVALNVLRTGRVDFARVVADSRTYVQAVLAGFVVGVFSLSAVLIPMVVVILPLFRVIRAHTTAQQYRSLVSHIPGPVMLPLCLCFVVPYALYLFAIPIITDRKSRFWAAMEESRKKVQTDFWSFFGFALALICLQVVGGMLLHSITRPFARNLGTLLMGAGSGAVMAYTVCAQSVAYRELWPEESEPKPESAP